MSQSPLLMLTCCRNAWPMWNTWSSRPVRGASDGRFLSCGQPRTVSTVISCGVVFGMGTCFASWRKSVLSGAVGVQLQMLCDSAFASLPELPHWNEAAARETTAARRHVRLKAAVFSRIAIGHLHCPASAWMQNCRSRVTVGKDFQADPAIFTNSL